MSAGAYRFLTRVVEPAAPAMLRLRAGGESAALHGERLGRARGVPGAPWFHAASLGEVRALESVLEAWRARGGVFQVTTTSVPGRARARERWGDAVSLAPLDLPGATRNSFDQRQPGALVLVETELWPNLLLEAARRGVPVGVANARISDRSWPWYRRLRWFFRPLVTGFRAVAARSEADAERWIELGARGEAVRVTGNTKVDGVVAARPVALPWGAAPVWTAGSVHPGELEAVLTAFALLRRDLPDLRLVLAPRHLWDREAWLEAARGPGFSVAARSTGAVNPASDILLLDTHGELAGWLAASTVAFIGGTLVPVGGHNPLEASSAGVPVAMGPHQANIRVEAARLRAAGAARTVRGAADLAAAVRAWCEDGTSRDRAAAAARMVVTELGGAGERTADWLLERGVLGAARA